LRFPHHDNEIAQAEARHTSNQWVNYFLHSGHLHIDGLKMSKSLKNFITIREALEKCTPRQIRFMVLLQPWNKIMNFSFDKSLEEARSKERWFTEFFRSVSALLLEQEVGSDYSGYANHEQRWQEKEHELYQLWQTKQTEMDHCLRDNFDTVGAMKSLSELVSRTNAYIQSHKDRRALLVQNIAIYVTNMLKIFGLVSSTQREFGFGDEPVRDVPAETRERIVFPYVKAISNFRKDLRRLCFQTKQIAPVDILCMSDHLRDETMLNLGVRLDDDGAVPFICDDPQVLMREKQEKKKQEEELLQKKLETKMANLKNEIASWEKKKTDPKELFRSQTDKYSQFDDKGIPTHDKDGKELTKGARKKLEKEFSIQEKNYKSFQEKSAKEPDFLLRMREELQSHTATK